MGSRRLGPDLEKSVPLTMRIAARACAVLALILQVYGETDILQEEPPLAE
jgi:hypothetical protein